MKDIKAIAFLCLLWTLSWPVLGQTIESKKALASMYVAYTDLYGYVEECISMDTREVLCLPLGRPLKGPDVDINFVARHVEKILCYDVLRVSDFGAHSDPWILAIDDSLNLYRISGFYPRTTRSDVEKAVQDLLPSCGLANWYSNLAEREKVFRILLPMLLGFHPDEITLTEKHRFLSEDSLVVQFVFHRSGTDLNNAYEQSECVDILSQSTGFLSVRPCEDD